MYNATFNESKYYKLHTHTRTFFFITSVIRKFESMRSLLVVSPNIPSFTYCCTCLISKTTIFEPWSHCSSYSIHTLEPTSVKFDFQGSVRCKYIPFDILPTRCNITQFISGKLLYMFWVVSPPIIRSTQLYLQYLVLVNRYCYLPLLWKNWNWFQCGVGIVLICFGVAADVSQLTSTRYCKYSCVLLMMGGDTTWNMYSSFPEINKVCNVASCWKYIKRNLLLLVCLIYNVVQIWPGHMRLVYTEISPGHIWTTLYFQNCKIQILWWYYSFNNIQQH